MMFPFEIQTESPNVTRIYIGRNTTVWFSYQKVIAFAVSGYGTFKLDGSGETVTTRKHLNKIPAKDVLPADEFNARLIMLAHGMDEEATRVIDRPSWASADRISQNADEIARDNGWER